MKLHLHTSLAGADRRMVIDHHRHEIIGAADPIGGDLSAWLE